MAFSFKQKKTSADDNLVARKHSLLNKQTSFAVVEGYKSIRTNLMFTNDNEEKCPIVLFSSPLAGEGKTTTCINMGITFAQAGLKTLIIDADMRRPQFYHLFDMPSSPGLSDVLVGLATEQDAIRQSQHANLFVLTSGTLPPNPAELLISKKVEKFFAALKEQFDYIFIDTPPILLVTDAVSLVKKVSGIILVTRQNYSQRTALLETVDKLEQIGGNIFGAVLNGAISKSGSYDKYRYKNRYNSKYGYHQMDYSSDAQSKQQLKNDKE